MAQRTRVPNAAKYRDLASRPGTWARMVNSTKFDCVNGCWEWQSTLNEDGYGVFAHHEMGTAFAHRLALHIVGRPVPADMTVDHLCENRRCVNPAHLAVVPGVDNTMRGNGYFAANARKTHCPQGHAYEGENVYLYTSRIGNTARACRTCMRDRYRAKKALKAS